MIDTKVKHRYELACNQASCSVLRHPQLAMADQLRRLANTVGENEQRDQYGQGALVASFEQQVAELLAKESALFLATGTLAQPLALKIHALNCKRSTVVLHPTSHLLLHEHLGVEAVWQLAVRQTPDASSPFTLAELKQCCRSDTAAIVFELPMREIGGELPPWHELEQQVAWARSQNIRCHLDGARLWQVSHFYQRSLDQVAALFDSVYVSFYKDLGGISGAMLLADQQLIDQARIWARRAGGNPITLYPEILAARDGLEKYLPLMPEAVNCAAALAKLWDGVDEVEVNPNPPKAAMFHLTFSLPPDKLAEKIIDYINTSGVVVLPLPRAGDSKSSICEISVGENAMSQPHSFWLRHVRAFAETLAD